MADLGLRITLVCFVLLRSRLGRDTAFAWVVVIATVPVLGGFFYLLFGEVHLGRRRSEQHARIQERVSAACADTVPHSPFPELSERAQPVALLAEHMGGSPPRGGHALELLAREDEFADRLVAEIEGARAHVHLLTYIFLADTTGRRVVAALSEAARRGVRCRVLVDAVGSRSFLDQPLADDLRVAGVELVAALPASPLRRGLARLDLRNHRKLVVVDGALALLGSHNVVDAGFAPKARYAPWIDASIVLRGPLVRDLQEVFVVDWYQDADESLEELLGCALPHESDGVAAQVLATGPNQAGEGMRQLIQAALQTAREEVCMTTPYFVPDQATLSALCAAAQRGVDVLLILPRKNDSFLVRLAAASFFEELLEAGVRIERHGQGLLHAKTITIDRELALLGSANLDRRSFELNFELSVLVYDSDFASQLRLLQRSYLNECEPVQEMAWRRRPWWRRLAQNAAGTLAPLL